MPKPTQTSFALQPIAYLRTPFKQKFAIPRQAGLVDIEGTIEFAEGFQAQEAIVGLEQVSHLWLHFIFHENTHSFSHTQVRPPRLGGNKRLGVLATRASFRPNGLGLSLVKIKAIKQQGKHIQIIVSGVDMLDNTPIVDIKPYLPYADIAEGAYNHIAPEKPEKSLHVIFSKQAQIHWQNLNKTLAEIEPIKALIALDPRPAYKQNKAGQFVLRFECFDVHWSCNNENLAFIEQISRVV